MSTVLGLDCKLYRNTGDYASPVWVEVNNVRDLSLSLEGSEADVTTRGSAGWREIVTALLEAGVEFQMVWDNADTNFTAIRDAFLNRGPIEFAVMTGDIVPPGSEGLRATMAVPAFSREENLEEAVMASVTVKPTRAAQPPEWMEIVGT